MSYWDRSFDCQWNDLFPADGLPTGAGGLADPRVVLSPRLVHVSYRPPGMTRQFLGFEPEAGACRASNNGISTQLWQDFLAQHPQFGGSVQVGVPVRVSFPQFTHELAEALRARLVPDSPDNPEPDAPTQTHPRPSVFLELEAHRDLVPLLPAAGPPGHGVLLDAPAIARIAQYVQALTRPIGQSDLPSASQGNPPAAAPTNCLRLPLDFTPSTLHEFHNGVQLGVDEEADDSEDSLFVSCYPRHVIIYARAHRAAYRESLARLVQGLPKIYCRDSTLHRLDEQHVLSASTGRDPWTDVPEKLPQGYSYFGALAQHLPQILQRLSESKGRPVALSFSTCVHVQVHL